MRRVTVFLTDELDARLREEAAHRGMTVLELTREAIERLVGGRRRRIAGGKSWHSGESDISERIGTSTKIEHRSVVNQ
jgi:hypothetical protein